MATINEILEAIKEGTASGVAILELAISNPDQLKVGCATAWVDIHYPKLVAVDALRRLLEDNSNCHWDYEVLHNGNPCRVGFVDPQHAVMFKLMLP